MFATIPLKLRYDLGGIEAQSRVNLVNPFHSDEEVSMKKKEFQHLCFGHSVINLPSFERKILFHSIDFT